MIICVKERAMVSQNRTNVLWSLPRQFLLCSRSNSFRDLWYFLFVATFSLTHSSSTISMKQKYTTFSSTLFLLFKRFGIRNTTWNVITNFNDYIGNFSETWWEYLHSLSMSRNTHSGLNLNSVNQLIFVMVKCGVLFEVRTGFLNNI
jgi:hypothetical protein